ncbi:MAG: DUF72 domain-containing protein, partial [Trebonia sp.]
MSATVRVGISGWRYPPWRGVFYPTGLAQRAELGYAASMLATIEINGTFYSLQRPESFAAWRDQTPDRFVFALKGPRFVTHLKKLRDVWTPLANFFASGVLGLGPKLGPMLWQLPPSLSCHPQRIEAFCHLLPRSTHEAAWLARRHDERLVGRALLDADADRPLHHALEVRHSSFAVAAFVEQMRKHQVAIVLADTAGRWPVIDEVTTGFRYVRLHGDAQLYTSGYSEAALDRWMGPRSSVGRRGPGRLRLLRQRRQGPRPVRRDGPRRPVAGNSATEWSSHYTSHGLISSMPVSRKSPRLRVASAARRVAQIAAICPSKPSMGRPDRSRSL